MMTRKVSLFLVAGFLLGGILLFWAPSVLFGANNKCVKLIPSGPCFCTYDFQYCGTRIQDGYCKEKGGYQCDTYVGTCSGTKYQCTSQLCNAGCQATQETCSNQNQRATGMLCPPE